MTTISVEDFYKENKAEIISLLIKEQQKVLTHAELEKTFIDNKNRQHSKFPKQMALPLERLGKLHEFFMYVTSGLNQAEWRKVLDSMNVILSEGLGQPKTAAKMAALIKVLEERLDMVMHTELLYNIVAIQWIREDENPSVFNNEIHLDKIATFKEMVQEEGSYFFFQNTDLGIVSGLLRLSEQEWTSLWHESEAELESLKKILDLLQSGLKSSDSAKKTSVNL